MNASLKLKLVLVIVATTIVGLLWWFYSHSYIEIVLSPGDSEVSYSVLDQRSKRIASGDIDKESVKILVRKGSHEVVIQDEERSYFAVVRTGGFLTSTKVTPSLAKENFREFIGNNPSPCPYLVKGVLLSSVCDGRIENLNIHSPASSDSPTVIKKAQTELLARIESVLTINDKPLIFVKTLPGSETHIAAHAGYSLLPDGSQEKGFALKELSEDVSYFFTQYKDGFLAASSGDSQLYYYLPNGKLVEKLSLPQPSAEGMTLAKIFADEGGVYIVYSNEIAREQGEFAKEAEITAHSEDFLEQVENREIKSELYLMSKDNQTDLGSFTAESNNIGYCGKMSICVLDDGLLSIYEMRGDHTSETYKITGVIGFKQSGGKLLVVKNEGVLALNPDEGAGTFSYKFSEYTYCGISSAKSGYILCIKDPDDNSSVLYVDMGKESKYMADKAQSTLLGINYIKGVSTYKNYMYISPDYGELVFVEELGGFYNDPDIEKSVNADIKKVVKELGLPRAMFKIINSYTGEVIN